MYEVFLLCAHQTVSLQLEMNVLRWIVVSHCIYRVSNCCLSVIYHCWAVTESWKNVLGVLESPGIICKQESGNPEGYFGDKSLQAVSCTAQPNTTDYVDHTWDVLNTVLNDKDVLCTSMLRVTFFGLYIQSHQSLCNTITLA